MRRIQTAICNLEKTVLKGTVNKLKVVGIALGGVARRHRGLAEHTICRNEAAVLYGHDAQRVAVVRHTGDRLSDRRTHRLRCEAGAAGLIARGV